MIRFENISFQYGEGQRKILDDLSLEIPSGAFLAIVGDNGAGKSTFCKVLNGIIPHFVDGELTGKLWIDDLEVTASQPYEIAGKVGYVYQDFENQILKPKVLEDVSFAPLNRGCEDYLEIGARSLEAVELVDQSDEFIWQLSGGQKHLLALAGVLAVEPDVLILDEPIAQLDPHHAKVIYENLRRLNQAGKTIIVIEHNMEFVGEYCDSVLFLQNQKVKWVAPVKEALQHVEELKAGGVFAPEVTLLGYELKQIAPNPVAYPVTVPEAEEFVKSQFSLQAVAAKEAQEPEVRTLPTKRTMLDFQGVKLAYNGMDGAKKVIFEELNLKIYQGDRIALIGNNGAGKSTLLKMMMGLERAQKGRINLYDADLRQLKTQQISDKIGYVYQNPESMFIEDSIEKDIAYSMKMRGVADYLERTEELLQMFHLEALRKSDGRLLSGGQMRRASLAIGIALNPECLLLDEPTSSLDMGTRDKVIEMLTELSETIETVVIASHDMRLVAEWANRIIVLNHGHVIGDGPKEEILMNEALLQEAGVRTPIPLQLSRRLALAPSFTLSALVEEIKQRSYN